MERVIDLYMLIITTIRESVRRRLHELVSWVRRTLPGFSRMYGRL